MFSDNNNFKRAHSNLPFSFLPNGTKRIKLDSNKRLIPDPEADDFTTGGGGGSDPSIITSTLTVKGDGNAYKFSVEDPTESKVFFIDTVTKSGYFRGYNFDIGFSPSSNLARFRADTINRYISFYARLSITSVHEEAFVIKGASNNLVFLVDTITNKVTCYNPFHVTTDDILPFTVTDASGVRHFMSCTRENNFHTIQFGEPDLQDVSLHYIESIFPKHVFNTKNFYIKGSNSNLFDILNFSNVSIFKINSSTTPGTITIAATTNHTGTFSNTGPLNNTGAFNNTGTAYISGVTTLGGNLVPSTGGTHSLGLASTRWGSFFANNATISIILCDKINFYVGNPTGLTPTVPFLSLGLQGAFGNFPAHGAINLWYRRYAAVIGPPAVTPRQQLTFGINIVDNGFTSTVNGGAAFISFVNINKFTDETSYPIGEASSGTIFFGSLESSFNTGTGVSPRFFMTAGTLGPCSNNAYNCGSNDFRWANVYATNIQYINLINLSDRSQKKNITYFQNSVLPLINSLKPCYFNYIDPDITQRCFGFIAQDVEESIQTIYPDLGIEGVVGYRYEEVEGEKKKIEGSATLNQLAVLPFLVKAVQELTTEIQLLKTELALLKTVLT